MGECITLMLEKINPPVSCAITGNQEKEPMLLSRRSWERTLKIHDEFRQRGGL